jgi:hypothetical protein
LAPSPARRYWWNGSRWVAAPLRQPLFERLPGWLKWRWTLWLAAVIAWIPGVFFGLSHHDSEVTIVAVAGALGGAAVIATVLFGVSLGLRNQWGYLAWSFLFGVGVIGLTVFWTFEASVPANAPDDPGTGLGAMLVTAMVGIVVGVVLILGAGIGTLARRLKLWSEHAGSGLHGQRWSENVPAGSHGGTRPPARS